ncbi:MAG TPA: hypothetical protein VFH26_04455 [Gemmatimonadales bacterium]|nr:hypothetical protein [Gemmatimonadales bacterium]
MKIITELRNHAEVVVRAFIAFLAVTGCGASSAPIEPPHTTAPRTYRVLFIGNSLTYFNDLPGTVAGLAQRTNVTMHVASVAGPNLALIDHVEGSSNALEVIGQGSWHYVVLQQGPSALPVSRDTLVLATRLLASHIEAVGARTALLMVWPELSRFMVFDDVGDSYRAAAAEVGGLFLPAGEAWRAAWVSDPQLPLYGPDGYHPSELGTYLAALVVYEGITGNDSRELPDEAIVGGRNIGVPGSRVRLLQEAAHETVTRFARN